MTVKRHAVLIAVICLLCSPCPAYAERGLWEWLERLSGPGPFHGWAVEVPVLCRFVKVTGTGETQRAPDSSPWDHTWRCWAPVHLKEPKAPVAEWRRQFYASLYFGRYTGSASELVYAAEPASRKIVWLKLGSTLTWEVHRFFDIHTGIDWNRLTSEEDVFPAISVASIELMGITWRPFAGSDSFLSFVSFPMRARLLARSFDAADFGAIPGTFKAGPEVQYQFGIAIDPWRHRR